ncbi:MAG TPA: 4'-phosphopantetheinyl transferase superfamily protein [Verrucomicrobiae bacterium]|jgi:4'-phosphopantetheinyl transferase|nr:4'-phosphopantetheinyl transferase superfamily protein [Verrucomicrobiae bacterium]
MSVQVDLWLWPLTADSGSESEHWRVMSADERARATRFVFDKHRIRYIHGRGRLRQILALYTGIAPEDIAFNLSAYDKPSLANALAKPLFFNLSHSGELAALGISGDAELGVDIEWIRELKEDISSRYFSASECAVLHALPEEAQPRAFFECWSRKEAYIKASGEGLSIPLNSFDVAFGPGVAPRFLRIDEPQPHNPEDWRLYAFEPEAGCMGAMAAKTNGAALNVNAAASEADAAAFCARLGA